MDYIFYLIQLLLAVVILSGIKMLSFLEKKGYKKTPLYYANPLLFIEYGKLTKAEDGKYGIWLKLFILSFCVYILLMVVHSIIEVFMS